MFKFVENNKIVIQVILGLVALTFVGFGVSSYSSVAEDPYLVKVGSTKIALRDIDRELDGQPINADARQRALEGLIQRNLILNEAASTRLLVGDAQLQQAIASIPAFQDNGKFSLDKYKDFLAKRQMTGPQFEERISRDLLMQNQMSAFTSGQITSQALAGRIGQILGETRTVSAMVLTPPAFASQVKLDDATIAAYYKANTAKFKAPEAVKLSYVVLSQAQLAQSLNVTDEELHKFYQQHLDQFGQEQRRASHILLTVPQGAAPQDVAKIKAEADAILKQVRANPASFAQVARARSQDPGSAEKGGDLGFFPRGAMVKAFDNVVFQMKPGQISEVVRSEYGFHIIRLDAIQQPDFNAVKEQVAQQLKLQKAAAVFRSQSDTLTEVAYQQGDSLKGVQDALKLVPQQSGWITRDPSGQDPLQSNPKVLAAAFSNDVLVKKHNSEPIDMGNNTLVVLRVTDHQPAHQLKLDEVRDAIKMQLIATEGAKLATAKGQADLADLKAGKPVTAQWTPTHDLSRQQAPQLPVADLRAIFGADVSKLPAYVGLKHDTGEYVIYRISALKPAPALTPDQLTQLTGLVGTMNTNAQVAGYLKALRTKYPVLAGKQKLNSQSQDE
ncbi:SurA N-terminal domain-containing protein [Paludibacterium sp. B53371]|uniref:SurA N-terminal domain-containing protein n=1 Tax=Paludibacterium sp. B53371 TaxID=2806263 RepID=UPI001C04C888|nr:SurA N-terminal domain-containing protein [Paludibacterium sp. B53371]